MPTGLKIPVGVNKQGRAAVESNESKNTQKILTLAFSEGGDDNAFQKLGLDDRVVFSVKTSAFRGRALNAVNNILAKFPELVRLVEGSVEFQEDIEGEFTIEFEYIDLLTQKSETFIKAFVKGARRTE